MIELPPEYVNKLANQFILISALLGGFSLAIIVSLLNTELKDRFMSGIFRAAILSAAFFLVTIFTMTNLLMITTEGFPFVMDKGTLNLSRILGSLSFFAGIISLLVIISLAGWTKSKRTGWFTTAIGTLCLILVFIVLT